MKRIILYIILSILIGSGAEPSFSQINPCTPNTPVYTVNLTGNPNGTWVSSPPIVRDGSCCGSQWPDRCIVFLITLDPSTIAINFNIASGAMPSGAMFYQIDCSTPTAVGQPICLQGPGPYALSFCKPGNNLNTYSITSIAGPSASPDDTVGIGCTTTLSASGLNPTTISWTSIAPGAQGTYNPYLSCTSGCSSVIVTPQTGAPAFVDYKVCGQSLAPSCLPNPNFCDTIRVYFRPPLVISISPDPAIYCQNSGGILLTGSATGGDGNYSFSWLNSSGVIISSSSSYFVTTPGTYTLQVTDGHYPSCPAKTKTITVTQEPVPIANAGSDFTMCASGPSIQLNGSVTNATGGIWSGGNGTLNPNNVTLNASYTPTATEISTGFVTLILTTTGNGACPPSSDQMTIQIKPPITVSISGPSVVCYGTTTTLTATVSGGQSTYGFLWSNGSPSQSVNVAAGTYTVTVSDASNNGCSAVATKTLTQNPPFGVTASPNQVISCSSLQNISAVASGGSGPYFYLWNTGSASSTISVYPGTYFITAFDAVGCTAKDTVVVVGVSSTLTANITQPVNACFGGTTNVAVVASGGFGGYSFQWSTGATSTTINVGMGTYCVTVTDAGTCKYTTCVTVQQNTAVIATITAPDPICNGSIALISVTGSGGAGAPYTYLWSTGQITQSITQSAGTYSVTVTDASSNACTAISGVTINNEPVLSAVVNSNSVSCFGGSNGNATVIASGGISPFTYSWSPSGGNNATAINLSAGSYTSVVTDNIGCIVINTVTITQPPVLNISISPFTNVSCYGGNNGEATVSASGGTPGYNYSWSPVGGVSATVTALPAGVYTVVVTDANGCSKSSTINITQPAAALAVSINKNNISCTGGSNGSATAIGSGGTTSYSYSWSNAANTQTINNLTQGSYTVTITDSKGCTATGGVSIIEPALLNVIISGTTSVACFGGSNGIATTSASGGTPPYSSLWSGGAGTNSTAVGLSAGSYTVTVTDSKGCQETAGAAITQPASALTATASADQNISCTNTVSLFVTVTGGTVSYSYFWNNNGTSDTIYTNTPGAYAVTVTDSKGCTASDVVNITANNSGLNVAISSPSFICSGTTTTWTAIASGGAGGYTYSWNNGSTASSIIAGGETNCVTVTDNAGCKFTDCNTIIALTDLTVALPSKTVCFGSTGTLTASVSGGLAPYSYLWSGGETTSSITKIPGTYSITVTDSIQCVTVASATISQATDLLIGFSDIHHVSCKGGGNGLATAVVSGGVNPYSYFWSPGNMNTGLVYGLSSGTYFITITDAIGCTKTSNLIIMEPATALLLDSINGSAVSCFGGSDGFAAVSAYGGTPPYNYLWWWNNDTSPVNTALPAGSYTVSVADTSGCTTLKTVYISQPSILIASFSGVIHVSCFGGSNGSATVQGSGGTSPYFYLWSNGSSGTTMSGVGAGTYSVTITDNKSCTRLAAVTITQPSDITITATSIPAICTSSTGSATASASGGVGPYNYFWSTFQFSQTITGLAPNTYTVIVTDASGCAKTKSVVVGSTISPVNIFGVASDVACNGYSDGSIIINAIGGAAPYTYQWVNIASTNDTVAALPAGTYTVIVNDTGACTDTAAFTLTQPAKLLSNVTKTNITCIGKTDGTATVTPSGGTSPYIYFWSTGNTNFSVSNLDSGFYYVIVTDVKGCSDSASFSIVEPSAITTTISNILNVTCNGDNSGAAVVAATGGGGPYSFQWSNAQSTAIVTGLISGVYYVTIINVNSCSVTDSVIITQPPPIAISMSVSNGIICPGGSSATINASASGGVSNFTYSWSNGLGSDTTQLVSPSQTTTYTVTVTDANNCTDTGQITVIVAAPVSLQINAVNDTICMGNSTTIMAAASGGTGLYTYNWLSPPLGNSAGPYTVSPSIATTYTVSVLDLCGATATASATIVVNPVPNVALFANPIDGCSPLTVSFSSNTAGNPNGTIYTWDFGEGGYSFFTNTYHTFTQPGAYVVTFTATSPNGCSVTVQNTDVINVYPQPVAAFAYSTGYTVTLVNPEFNFVDQSQGAETWSWDLGDGTTSNEQNVTHTYTQPQAYTIIQQVANQYGCMDTAMAEITIKASYIFFIPNAFSPFTTGGKNDIFIGKGICISEYEMHIFDRWGGEIFYTNDQNTGWDGRVHNSEKPVQIGVYVYVVLIKDCLDEMHTYIGHVTVVK